MDNLTERLLRQIKTRDNLFAKLNALKEEQERLAREQASITRKRDRTRRNLAYEDARVRECAQKLAEAQLEAKGTRARKRSHAAISVGHTCSICHNDASYGQLNTPWVTINGQENPVHQGCTGFLGLLGRSVRIDKEVVVDNKKVKEADSDATELE